MLLDGQHGDQGGGSENTALSPRPTTLPFFCGEEEALDDRVRREDGDYGIDGGWGSIRHVVE